MISIYRKKHRGTPCSWCSAAIREISFLRLPALQMSTSTSSLMPRGNFVFNSSSTVNLCLCLPTVFSFSPGSASTARQSAHRLAKQRMESNGSNLISISSISGPNDTSAFFPLCIQLGHKRPVVLPPTPTHLPLLLFHPLLVSTFRRPRPPPTTRDHHSKRGRNFLEWDATDHMSELSHARWMRSIRRPCPRLGQSTKKGEKKKRNKTRRIYRNDAKTKSEGGTTLCRRCTTKHAQTGEDTWDETRWKTINRPIRGHRS